MCDPYTSTHTIITVTVKKCHHSPPDLPPLCVTHIPALIQSLQQTRPSILCVTQKGLLCLYILYWVSKGLVCLYILEKVEIWSGVTDASQTDRQTTEYRATQLLSSIKHKLSHAIYFLAKAIIRPFGSPSKH